MAGVAAALVVATVVVVTALVEHERSTEPTAPASTSPSTTVATSTTTTTIVIERTTLPAGTAELATARPEITDVQVRSTPPPGWDSTLSPVVTSSTPQPPRSGLDAGRVPLPSAEVPIAGRHVSQSGWTFSNPTTYQPPQPLVFGVVQRQGDWVQVQLPVRPNGTTGWVSGSQVTVASTTRSVQISLSERRLRLVDQGSTLLDVPVGIGRPSTPTPSGAFTVTDIVPSLNPAGGYGPVALALDGYSEVMDSFAGESGTGTPDEISPVLAIHGTNQPSSVGAARSNGCPRLYNQDVLQLAQLAPAGTPVQIWP